jgi:hypothetical protein
MRDIMVRVARSKDAADTSNNMVSIHVATHDLISEISGLYVRYNKGFTRNRQWRISFKFPLKA